MDDIRRGTIRRVERSNTPLNERKLVVVQRESVASYPQVRHQAAMDTAEVSEPESIQVKTEPVTQPTPEHSTPKPRHTLRRIASYKALPAFNYSLAGEQSHSLPLLTPWEGSVNQFKLPDLSFGINREGFLWLATFALLAVCAVVGYVTV